MHLTIVVAASLCRGALACSHGAVRRPGRERANMQNAPQGRGYSAVRYEIDLRS
jgi:hypothetical protein